VSQLLIYCFIKPFDLTISLRVMGDCLVGFNTQCLEDAWPKHDSKLGTAVR